MTVNVGVIGVGMIGKDHIRRLTTVLAGANVVAVTDVNLDEAKKVADGLTNAQVHSTGQELIADEKVDAIVVCSWGPTHEEYVLAAIAAGKPVFCEKPLATSQEACLRIIDAEVAFGKRLVQVGYMRRYDRAYRALKAVVDSGEIGTPLIMHCTHRNPVVPGHYTKDMAITDTAVHDIDIAAYDVEFQEWIDGVRDGGTYGPSSWDGYAAAVVSDAAVESIKVGTRTSVKMAEKPDLYN